MTHVSEEESQRLILDISRKLDAISETVLVGDSDWDPLHDVLPMKHCNGFMWMYRSTWNEETVEVYKHGITRRYLHLDHNGRAYEYHSDRYVEIPVDDAVDHVFENIEEMGATRETRYNEEYVREKHRRARELGWTIIS